MIAVGQLSPAMDANMNEDNNNQDSNTSRMIKTGTSGGGAGSGSGAGGLDASISVMSTIRTTGEFIQTVCISFIATI